MGSEGSHREREQRGEEVKMEGRGEGGEGFLARN